LVFYAGSQDLRFNGFVFSEVIDKFVFIQMIRDQRLTSSQHRPGAAASIVASHHQWRAPLCPYVARPGLWPARNPVSAVDAAAANGDGAVVPLDISYPQATIALKVLMLGIHCTVGANSGFDRLPSRTPPT
jgi:hypothetical protein